MQGLLEFVRSLGAPRIAAMVAVTIALVGFFAFLILRVTAPQMTPLFTDLSYEDSAAIVKDLERQGVAYELRNDGNTVMVPRDRVARLRMSLAGEGLPKGGGMGYEIFDKSDALGTTSFVQNINNLRALEGELSRSIRGLDRVVAARVHLVLPERPLFSRDKVEPSASIVLKVHGTLEAQQVRAIRHLVASAVNGLKPQRVSIVDEAGHLLADGTGDSDNGRDVASTNGDRGLRSGCATRSTRSFRPLSAPVERTPRSAPDPRRQDACGQHGRHGPGKAPRRRRGAGPSCQSRQGPRRQGRNRHRQVSRRRRADLLMSAPAKFLFDVDFAAGSEREATIALAEHAVKLAEAETVAHRRGYADAQRDAAIEAGRRVANTLDRIAVCLGEANNALHAIETRLECEAVEVAFTVARKLAPALLEREPFGEISALASACFRELIAAPHLAVRVNDLV